MNKAICKQILQTIDDIEIEGLSLDDLRSELESNLPALQNAINMILPELTTLHVLKQTGNLIDLVPCAAIFIRSHPVSYTHLN